MATTARQASRTTRWSSTTNDSGMASLRAHAAARASRLSYLEGLARRGCPPPRPRLLTAPARAAGALRERRAGAEAARSRARALRARRAVAGPEVVPRRP